MFEIEYKGGNGVVLATKSQRLVADPKLSVVGLKDISVVDAIELGTEARFLSGKEARLTIEGPGEYEVGPFSIRGIGAIRHIDSDSARYATTMYRIGVGDVSVALLGNIAAKLTEEQLEAIGVVDIVVLPVGGGGYTLDAQAASRLIRQIDPKVVIPVHYDDPSLKYEVPQDSLKMFIDELGAPVETIDKYKLKSAAMLPSVLTVVELKRS